MLSYLAFTPQRLLLKHSFIFFTQLALPFICLSLFFFAIFIKRFIEKLFMYHTFYSFKIYMSMFLSIFTDMCNHHYGLFQNILIFPKESLYPSAICPPPRPQQCYCLLSVPQESLVLGLMKTGNVQYFYFCDYFF